jgi:hypothetical protein
MRLIKLILLCFEANREMAEAKRSARRAGIDPDTDAEFQAVNQLD